VSVCHCILDNMRSDLSWHSSRVAMEHGMARCQTDCNTDPAMKVTKVRPVTHSGVLERKAETRVCLAVIMGFSNRTRAKVSSNHHCSGQMMGSLQSIPSTGPHVLHPWSVRNLFAASKNVLGPSPPTTPLDSLNR
jgi:hypothetical protein